MITNKTYFCKKESILFSGLLKVGVVCKRCKLYYKLYACHDVSAPFEYCSSPDPPCYRSFFLHKENNVKG